MTVVERGQEQRWPSAQYGAEHNRLAWLAWPVHGMDSPVRMMAVFCVVVDGAMSCCEGKQALVSSADSCCHCRDGYSGCAPQRFWCRGNEQDVVLLLDLQSALRSGAPPPPPQQTCACAPSCGGVAAHAAAALVLWCAHPGLIRVPAGLPWPSRPVHDR